MLHVALWEPEIPPNTGNIARLCAATGAPLHLIGRLGFRLDEKSLKRAGLDYWPHVEIHQHPTFDEFLAAVEPRTIRLIDNPAPKVYTEAVFGPEDVLLFGSESKGLPIAWRERFQDHLGIPMPTGKVRSLNLATAVGIVLYEAMRQLQVR